MRKAILLFCVITVLFSAMSCGKVKNSSSNDEVDVYQVGISWVDNIIDAHNKIINSSNTLSKDANIKYMEKCISYYTQTLDHANDEEKKALNKYFEDKAKELGLRPEDFLNYGG